MGNVIASVLIVVAVVGGVAAWILALREVLVAPEAELDPGRRVAWVAALAVVPFIGTPLYWMTRRRPIGSIIPARRR